MGDRNIYSIPGFSDPLGSLSHLGGEVVFALLSDGLLRRDWQGSFRFAAVALFAVSSVLLLAVSGFYHLLEPGYAGRMVMQRLDHAAIYGLIAGTFTLVYAIFFRGLERWLTLAFVWTVAAAGITLKTIFFDLVTEGVSVTLYLGFDWVGLYSGTLIARRYGLRFIRPLIWGAVAYTVGAISSWPRIPRQEWRWPRSRVERPRRKPG